MKQFIAVLFIALHLSSVAAPSFLSASHALKTETLSGGSTVRLSLSNVSTETLEVGALIDATCQSGLSIKGVQFIRPGAPAKLRVISAERPKGFGKAGAISLQAVSVTAVDGTEVPIRGGDFTSTGKDKSTASIVLGLFVCILFLTMKGGEAVIAPGTTVDAFVANDMEIEVG